MKELKRDSKKRFDIVKDWEMKQLSLRKQKVEVFLNEKRRKGLVEAVAEWNSINQDELRINAATRGFAVKDIKDDKEDKVDIVKVKSMLSSQDTDIRNYAILCLRAYFIANNPTNITLVKKLNLIHLLSEILSCDDTFTVQNEIYWVFIHFVTSESKSKSSNNFIDTFSQKTYIAIYNKSLSLSNDTLKKTVIHFVINISFLSTKCRRALFNEETIQILLAIHKDDDSEGDNYSLVLLLGILVKKQKNVAVTYMNTLYDIFICHLMRASPSHEMEFCCLFGLVNLSDYIPSSWPQFSHKSIEDKLIDFILTRSYNDSSNKSSISLMHSIQLLTNLLMAEDFNMSEYLLSKHILDFLLNIIQSTSSSMIITEVLLTLKNISVGQIEEITQLTSHLILPHCTGLLSHPNLFIKREVTNIISNCLHYKSNSIAMKIYSTDFIEALIAVFQHNTDSTLLLNCLKILLQLLLADNTSTNYFLFVMQEKRIEDLIEAYQLSINKDILIITNAILNRIASV